MDLIIIIIIISIVSKLIKKSQETEKKQLERNRNVWDAMKEQSTPTSSNTSTQWQKAAQENIEKGRQRARAKVNRAKANAAEYAEDITLQTMEAEHHHSECVFSAEHHHPEDIIPENVLGTVEDLMVKGYDGNLCFERDFVGEAMDMISRFTVPSDIPEFKKDDDDAA